MSNKTGIGANYTASYEANYGKIDFNGGRSEFRSAGRPVMSGARPGADALAPSPPMLTVQTAMSLSGRPEAPALAFALREDALSEGDANAVRNALGRAIEKHKFDPTTSPLTQRLIELYAELNKNGDLDAILNGTYDLEIMGSEFGQAYMASLQQTLDRWTSVQNALIEVSKKQSDNLSRQVDRLAR